MLDYVHFQTIWYKWLPQPQAYSKCFVKKHTYIVYFVSTTLSLNTILSPTLLDMSLLASEALHLGFDP